MGTRESKQYLALNGKPIIVHTLEAFSRIPWYAGNCACDGDGGCPSPRILDTGIRFGQGVRCNPGEARGKESVYQGIKQISSEWVMIHDGVRPFVTQEEIEACRDAAIREGASVLGVPVKDTIKQVNGKGQITGTPDRQSLWAVQTPQAFRLSDLLSAHEALAKDGFTGTDDAMLMERAGHPVTVVEGNTAILKSPRRRIWNMRLFTET